VSSNLGTKRILITSARRVVSENSHINPFQTFERGKGYRNSTKAKKSLSLKQKGALRMHAAARAGTVRLTKAPRTVPAAL
jgi:hypothetical protein